MGLLTGSRQCVADLPEEAVADILRILQELDGQSESVKGKESRKETAKCKEKAEHPDDSFPWMDFSGDGEEVFGKMLDDLIYMSQLISALYSTVFYLADNRMSREKALQSGLELMEEADAVLEEWQRYSMSEE
ncbi:MAG: hypothetical protein LUG55_01005 [Clostridiales bacterium]|nr:hypothetical protein [Clostridiales bacterium]